MNARRSKRLTAAAIIVLGCMVGFAALAQAQPRRRNPGGPPPGAPIPTGAFRVDPVHSSIIFKIKHFGAANFYGRINTATGSFDLKDGGSLEVMIDMNSINSGDMKRDQHLKGSDFFSVKEFPEASFKSTSLKKTGENAYEAEGLMTLHGVTKNVTAKVEMTGNGKGRTGPVQGMESKLTIKRSDFGMKGMIGPLGDDVDLIVSLEGAQ